MSAFQHRKVLLVEYLDGASNERIENLSRYATGLSDVHTVMIATQRAIVPQLKADLAKRAVGFGPEIEVIGFEPKPHWKALRSLSTWLYRLIWNFFLARFIKYSGVQCDLVEVIETGKTPVAHFMWMLDRPVVWGEIDGFAPLNRSIVNGFFEGAAYYRYLLKQVSKFIRFHFDPFLLLSLHKTQHVVLSHGTHLNALTVDGNKTSNRMGFQFNVAQTINESTEKEGLIFLCSVDYDYPSALDMVLKAFAGLVKHAGPTMHAKLSLTIINNKQREARVMALIEALQISAHVKWLDDPSREEMNEVYQQAYAFVSLVGSVRDQGVANALSHGLPIVVASNSMARELTGDAGLSIAMETPGQIVSDVSFAFRQLIFERDLRDNYAMLSLARYRNYFSTKLYVKRKLELMESIYTNYNYYQLINFRRDKSLTTRALVLES